ncbi:MAG: hypothetical protein ABIS69_07250 [Sediminibacterium sp.]
MKLRLTLVLFCLLGVGIFSHAQDKKKPTVMNAPEEVPVSVTSKKKAKHVKPPPLPKAETVKFAPPRIVKDKNKVQPPPPPKVAMVTFAPPRIIKDKPNLPPPPPVPKQHKEKPVKPDAPPAADYKG